MDTSDRSFTDVSVAAGLCLSARGIAWLRAHRGIANTIYRAHAVTIRAVGVASALTRS
jgi:hypothetical protein